MVRKFTVLLVGLFLLLGSQAQAAVTPISVAIVPPVQFPPSDFTVAGARVSLLWGNHRNVYGFDFGLLGNYTEHTFAGVAVAGGLNYTKGTATVLGLQAAGLSNYNAGKANVYGLQAALGFNANIGESKLVGLQVAALSNYSPHATVVGAQVGLYNKARVVYGFQIGLINVTESLHGIQIGLVNFHKKGLFSVAPLINIGF